MASLVCRCVVTATGGVLLHLGEDPGIGGGGAADHHGVAASFAHHARGVFWGVDVAVANHGNSYGLLDGGDDVPVGGAGVTLGAGARVDSHAFDAYGFGEFRDLHGDDGVFVPPSAQFDGEGNFYGGAHGAEDVFQQWKIAEKAGAAALHYLFGRTAEIDVHGVEPEVFDHLGGFCHDGGIGAK